MTDEWMRLALVEAALVVDEVYPYPPVGVILVHDGHLVARAHNGKPGSLHAELLAIAEAERRAYVLSDMSLYTTLEPCSNVGLTNSCAKAIIEAKISEVHVAILDPYHLVRGAGILALKNAGVHVFLGEYEEETRALMKKYLARFCPHCGWPVLP